MKTEFHITEKQLDLLRHTLGLNTQRTSFRNVFVADDNHADMPDLLALEAVGLMVRRENADWMGGGVRFHATENGKEVAIASLPPARKQTKYQQYLNADGCRSFAEWLGIDRPKREYDYFGTGPIHRLVRLKSRRATGGFAKTLKEAKASYKAALLKLRTENQTAKEFV